MPSRRLPPAILLSLALLPACNKKPDATTGPGDETDPHTIRADVMHLWKIGEATLTTADRNGGQMPSPVGVRKPGPDAKPLLSWRVHILPALGEQALFAQFKLDEPWDSPDNKPLVEKMPAVFRNPKHPAPPGHTFVKAFVGPGTAFDPVKPANFPLSFTDGTSNSILAVEVDPPVAWTKPEDIPYDPAKPLPELKLGGGSRIGVLMADGSGHTIDAGKVTEKSVRDAILIADGQGPGPDFMGQGPNPPGVTGATKR